ncbi:hypothetical protein [Rhodanobacter caeni]|uniref:Uncharacterized protein n=1 Tax=Rhodanobacter caeni TaxID=657654 RepID=A0ABP3ECR8_9GAMM
MGNTNLPQFGAAGADNSRDTLSGTEQLTDQQRGKSPSSAGHTYPPADAVPAPGQSRDTARKRPLGPEGEPEPGTAPATDDLRAYAGHHNTGHSPSDAT